MSRRQTGFTLLELLVALAVFAVMVTVAWGGLRHVLETDREFNERMQYFARISSAISLIEQDFSQALPRAIRDELGTGEPALYAPPNRALVALTRHVAIGAVLPQRVDALRVSYEFDNGVLYRTSWPVLDRTPAAAADRVAILDGLASVDFAFFTTEWQAFWPPPAATGGNLIGDGVLPAAVELLIRFENGNELRRVILI